MSSYKVEVLGVEKTVLGEGPHWDASSQTLYFVDIVGSQVGSYHPESGKSAKITIDSECLGEPGVGFVIPIAGRPHEFVIGQGRSLKRLEWDSVSDKATKVTTIYNAHEESSGLAKRFNDAKCDAAGRLWAGTMAAYVPNPPPEVRTAGILFKLDTDGTVSKHERDIGCSNGLAWSRDNKTMYYIDSYTRRVDAFDYDAGAGTISNRRAAFDFEKENEAGIPDGMTIDVDGNLWVACYSGSKVIRIDPTVGKVIGRVELPARDITSVTFGGPNLDVLYVTSISFGYTPEEKAATPAAGAIFKVTNLGTKGLSPGIPFAGKF